jgi:hypothetical protein
MNLVLLNGPAPNAERSLIADRLIVVSLKDR